MGVPTADTGIPTIGLPMAPHLGLLAPMEKVERHPQVVLADFIQAMVSQRCQARLE